MVRWLFFVETICRDHDRQDEFNRWYDEIHIPDVLKGCPEFLACRRYKLISGVHGYGAYLTVIEIETNDIDRTLETHRKNSECIRAGGRWTDLIEVVSHKLYKLDREL
jgi:hypothetical protein